MTLSSRLHPYPAMLSEDLAIELADRFVQPSDRMLDPFCGTGRSVIAAARRGAICLGTDVNPLACLLTLARAAAVPAPRVLHFAQIAETAPRCQGPEIECQPDGCTVDWLPVKGARELGQIVGWLNETSLTTDERLVLTAVLSATTRDVSFARRSGWKLHRMPACDRAKHRPSAWATFSARLKLLARDLVDSPPMSGAVESFVADATNISTIMAGRADRSPITIVITSPPYGDSRTTVQYGGISGLCMSTIRHVRGLNVDFMGHRTVDRRCVGGTERAHSREQIVDESLRAYWKGGAQNEARVRVRRFLTDLGRALDQIASVVSQDARVVMVVGRRLAGGRRVALDRFVRDRLRANGFGLETTWERSNGPKRIPHRVNSHGRMAASAARVVRTMTSEHVLVLRKMESK